MSGWQSWWFESLCRINVFHKVVSRARGGALCGLSLVGLGIVDELGCGVHLVVNDALEVDALEASSGVESKGHEHVDSLCDFCLCHLILLPHVQLVIGAQDSEVDFVRFVHLFRHIKRGGFPAEGFLPFPFLYPQSELGQQCRHLVISQLPWFLARHNFECHRLLCLGVLVSVLAVFSFQTLVFARSSASFVAAAFALAFALKRASLVFWRIAL